MTTTRAERAAKRRNRKIAARYPLLATQLAETVEQNAERLERQDKANDVWMANLNKLGLAAWKRGEVYKSIARENLPFELWEELESRYQRIYGNRGKWGGPEHVGHDLADWWWCALRDNNVPWCWDHCPNSIFHDLIWQRKEGECPTCHKPLEKPKERPVIIQMALLENV